MRGTGIHSHLFPHSKSGNGPKNMYPKFSLSSQRDNNLSITFNEQYKVVTHFIADQNQRNFGDDLVLLYFSSEDLFTKGCE